MKKKVFLFSNYTVILANRTLFMHFFKKICNSKSLRQIQIKNLWTLFICRVVLFLNNIMRLIIDFIKLILSK